MLLIWSFNYILIIFYVINFVEDWKTYTHFIPQGNVSTENKSRQQTSDRISRHPYFFSQTYAGVFKYRQAHSSVISDANMWLTISLNYTIIWVKLGSHSETDVLELNRISVSLLSDCVLARTERDGWFCAMGSFGHRLPNACWIGA